MHARSLFALALVLLTALPALAQDQKTLNKLLVAAYSLRRRGKFRASAAAYEQVLAKVKDKTAKRVLSLEAARLYVVMDRPEKALLLYRRNHDIVREISLLFSLDDEKRTKEALTICRYVNYPRGEAMALAKLGKSAATPAAASAAAAEALKIMELQGLQVERATLMHELKRYGEAAKVFEGIQDFYRQAKALQASGATKDAERAFEDAIEQIRFALRDPNGSLKRVKAIKKLHEAAKTGVVRERTRLALAVAYGQLAGDYRRLAESYSGSNRAEYTAKAPQLAKNALSFLVKQKTLFEDADGGGDAFGKVEVLKRGVDTTIAKVEAEIARYGW
jgi:tetratricopeptide (TPR) repeat protein